MITDTYLVYIDFGSGLTLYDAQYSNFTKTEVMHKGLKGADNICAFTLVPSITLANQLRNIGSEGALVNVKKNGIDYFYGYIRKTFTIKKTARTQPISVEAVAPSFRLKRKIQANIAYIGYAVSNPASPSISIIHNLLIHSGMQVDQIIIPSIPYILPALLVKENAVSYYELIENLLYQYGYIFNFDDTGRACVYAMRPDTVVSSQIFNSSNIIGSVEQKVVEDEQNIIEVEWAGVEVIENSTVFSDTSGGDSSTKASIKLAAGAYYGASDGSTEMFAEYRISDKKLIYAYNCLLSWDRESGIEAIVFTPFPSQALISIRNTSSSEKTISRLDIVGTAIVEKVKNKSKVITSISENSQTVTIQADYVFEKTAADDLASIIAWYSKYRTSTFTLKSRTFFPIGTVAIIDDAEIGSFPARITAKKTVEKTDTISYELESIADYTPSSSTLTVTVQAPAVKTGLDGNHESVIFCRAPTTPSTPSGNTPSGWYDAPPTNTELGLLWMSKGTKNSNGVLVVIWSPPVTLSGEQGNPGPAGGSVTWDGDLPDFPNAPLDSHAFHNTTTGKSYVFNEAGDATYPDDSPDEITTFYPSDTVDEIYGVYPSEGTWFVMTVDAKNLLVQWSSDNANWHTIFESGDLFMRTSSDGGYYWEPGARVVGEDGADSTVPGPQGENAIVMTSATTPSGTFAGQLGLWLGRLYRWGGGVWRIIETTPKYLGTVHTVPTGKAVYIYKGPTLAAVDAAVDDWILMTESGTAWIQGDCYKWKGEVVGWVHLDFATTSGVPVNYEEYHSASTDILAISALRESVGHFGALFASQLMAQKAMIDELSTKLIKLQSGGKIESADPESGFSLDGDTGLLNAQNVDISGIVNASGGIFTGYVSSRYGFILESLVPTNAYARITWEYIRIYSRKSAYTNPVIGDTYNELTSSGSALYVHDGATYQPQSYFNQYSIHSPFVGGERINSGLNTIVSTTTWQNVLGESFYNEGAVATGFINIPIDASHRLQVKFEISYFRGIAAIKLDTISNTLPATISTLISIQDNRLKCKKYDSTNGQIYWIKLN